MENKQQLILPEFTAEDIEKIEKYKEEGLPGLDTVADDQISRMLDLYLDGKTYHQISRMMRVRKDLIMYLGQKFDWLTARLDYLSEVENQIVSRTIEAKVKGQDFLISLQLAFQKRLGKKVEAYLTTGNETHLDGVSLKEVEKYIKIMETIEKYTSVKAKRGDKPLVGLNVGDGMKITKTGENEIEITPKEKTKAEKLREFADVRRQEEANKAAAKSDIKKNEPQQGESNET